MKNIYLNIFNNNKKNIKKARGILKKNCVIAVPTETVYGLAGNAYSSSAINKIYKIKGRPKKNPLIIHYYNLKQLKKDVFINKNFLKLYNKFSPGPLTYVLKKRKESRITSLATSNLKTVAVRFPSHKVIRSVLKELKFPLAIPSANISTGVSPVTAHDVVDEFGNKVKFVLNGRKSKIGLESTVIKLDEDVRILRPGVISKNQISKFLGIKIKFLKKSSQLLSPGMLKKHYSPGIPIKLNCKKNDNKAAFIVFGKKYKSNKDNFNLSIKGSLKEAGKNLYGTLRKIKKLKYKKINVVKITNKGIGSVINDRLKRASN